MPSIEEILDNEDCMPVKASQYFNKDKAFSKNSLDHTNGNGGTNGKALRVSTSSTNGSSKSIKSVTKLESHAFSNKFSFAKRPIELLDDDDVIVEAAKVGWA